MATYSNFETVPVTSIGGVFTLDSSLNWDAYYITSSTGAPITVTGTIDIQPTGTIIEGLTYEFIYDGTLLGTNTFTVFGQLVPLSVRDKNLKITAVRIGNSWVVTIVQIPDFNTSGQIIHHKLETLGPINMNTNITWGVPCSIPKDKIISVDVSIINDAGTVVLPLWYYDPTVPSANQGYWIYFGAAITIGWENTFFNTNSDYEATSDARGHMLIRYID